MDREASEMGLLSSVKIHTSGVIRSGEFRPYVRLVSKSPVGRGTYGTVHAIRLNRCGRKLTLAMKTANDPGGHSSLVLKRECTFLSMVRGHPNVVRLLGIIPDPCGEGLRGYMMDLFEMDLRQLMIRHHRGGPRLHRFQMRGILKGIVSGLAHVHSSGVVHGDLKPSNILVGNDLKPRIADFGISEVLPEDGSLLPPDRSMVSTNYRPPEIMEGKPYGTPVDVWSLGCIAVELLLPLKGPLFLGTTEDQVKGRIFEIMGPFWNGVPPPDLNTLISLGPREREDLILPALSQDPSSRPCASDILSHPFFRDLL